MASSQAGVRGCGTVELFVDDEPAPIRHTFAIDHRLMSKVTMWIRHCFGLGAFYCVWPHPDVLCNHLRTRPDITYSAVGVTTDCKPVTFSRYRVPIRARTFTNMQCLCVEHGTVRDRKETVSIGLGRRVCQTRFSCRYSTATTATDPATPTPVAITEAEWEWRSAAMQHNFIFGQSGRYGGWDGFRTPRPAVWPRAMMLVVHLLNLAVVSVPRILSRRTAIGYGPYG